MVPDRTKPESGFRPPQMGVLPPLGLVPWEVLFSDAPS
jgi:hypothetical protein